MELDHLQVSRLPWLTPDLLLPAGEYYQAVVPDTLDLAERAREAVHGLAAFLDDQHHHASFGHGVFAVTPPCFIHDGGQDQNWGKVLEALVLARAMCGSREQLERQRASCEAMLSYAELKRLEPYPVPLARILMAVEALHRYAPHAELCARIARFRADLTSKIQVDAQLTQGFFGPAEDRWKRDERNTALGVPGHGLNVFTAGSVLRALERADALSGAPRDDHFPLLLRNNLLDARYWDAPGRAQLAIPSAADGHGQFAGHHHSYTAALLGLLYYARAHRDLHTLDFVRRSYEHLRTFGIARIGLLGESCTAGDMTYLAVRLSQSGVGDYWEDVDQYVRNHLTEVQLLDTDTLARLVQQHARPLSDLRVGGWVQGIDTRDAVNRSRGLFWSDATHPTLIPMRTDAPVLETCLQWVVCCSGNCTKALHVVWDGMLEYDDVSQLATVHLLLNRASAVLDVESHLPHEGRVVIRTKRACRLAVRVPRWVDKAAVQVTCGAETLTVAWLGHYVFIPALEAGAVVTIEFPMVETTEVVELGWRLDQFWLESTQPPTSWLGALPTRFTLKFRGNTLAELEPRDAQPGYPLYRGRSLQLLRAPARLKEVTRFVLPGVDHEPQGTTADGGEP
ncbi:MAG: hypothetical protein MUF48_15915 [Pirellulaceae bacterium]|jgi:hypothetical protein|nr:hypothetical protein [Pirellulaceae bacterium]